MQVCVQWLPTSEEDVPRDVFVVAVAGCAVCVFSTQWTALGGTERWNPCLPSTAVAGLFELTHLTIHTVRETERHAFSVVRLCDHVSMHELAAGCNVHAADSLLQMSEMRVMKLGHGRTVGVRVRMHPTWKVAFDRPAAIPSIAPVQGDPVPDCYTIAKTKRVGLAAWASAAYAPLLGDGDWRAVLRRFARQTELAACLLGHDLTARLSPHATSEIAAELLLAPLRSHGTYVVDTMRRHRKHKASGHADADDCDIPTIPLFMERVAYDCEDAAAFAVRSSNELWGLLQLLRVRGTGFNLDLAENLTYAECTGDKVAAIAACLQLAADYAPLLLTVKRSNHDETLHVMALLVCRQGLLNLFGYDWQMALASARLSPATRTSSLRAEPRMDIGISLPPDTLVQADVVADAMPCVAEACALMSGCVGEPVPWAKTRTPDYRCRFLFGLSEKDSFYGSCKVVAVYGAACGLDLEARNMTLLQLMRDVVNPDIVMKQPTSGKMFFYDRCVQTLLPGPAYPPECSQSIVPPPVARKKLVALTFERGGQELRLFDGMPCASLA